MVWLLLPYLVALDAVFSGRAHRYWLFALAPAYAVQALQLTTLKGWYPSIRQWEPWGEQLVWFLRESKCFTALAIGLACFVLSRATGADDGTAQPLPHVHAEG